MSKLFYEKNIKIINIKSYKEMPINCRKYIKCIEKWKASILKWEINKGNVMPSDGE